MNKANLIEAIASESGLSKKDSKASLEALMNIVVNQMKKKETISLIGFGSFNAVDRASRTAKVPGTDKIVKVPAKTVVKFKPGALLKDI